MAARPAPFLFDLDGTLADTLDDIAASANHVRAGHGLPPLPRAGVQRLVGHGARALLEAALAEVHPDAATVDAAVRSYGEHHAVACTATARLYPGVREGLERLRAAGHALAVVTNKPERFARRIVAHLGLGDLLTVVVGGDTLAVRKPDPAPLRHALEQLGAGDDARVPATMVGDGEPDLRAARAAGLRAVACLYGYGDPVALRALGADAYWTRFLG